MKKHRDLKEVLAVENTLQEWNDLRTTAKEIANLKSIRISSDAFFSVVDINEDLQMEVGITKREYSAIRRYLLKNRVKKLRSIGIDI